MKKLSVIFKSIVLLCFSLFFSQCVNSGGAKGGANKKYTEFFIEGGHMQYYVSPQEYENAQTKEKLKIDYTMRDSIINTSSIDVNFTLMLDNPVKRLEKLSFVFDDGEVSISALNRIFIEKVKNNYSIRYNGKIVYKDWTQTQKNSHVIKTTLDGKEVVFEPTKKALKSMKSINNSVVDIMNLSIENKQ